MLAKTSIVRTSTFASAALLATTLATLTVPAGAQSSSQQTPKVARQLIRSHEAPGTARLELSTGELTRGDGGGSEKSASLAPAFVNTDSSGFASLVSSGPEWVDFGTITDDTGSDILGQFTFGYGTSATDTTMGGLGARVALRFYEGHTGFCADSGSVPTASFSLTGLPGSLPGSFSTWIITVDLAGGFEFCHPGAGNSFGFGFEDLDYDVVGQIGVTGPILCYAGALTDPINDPDANGQQDIFDVYDPDVETGVCLGTFFFGGLPFNFSSWYLAFDSVDAAASTQATATKRNTTNPDAYDPKTLPILGTTYEGTVRSSCGGSAAVLVLAPNAGAVTTMFGDVLLGNGPYLFFGPFTFNGGLADVSVALPKDISQCGLLCASQSFEIGCSKIELHNAVDLILGF